MYSPWGEADLTKMLRRRSVLGPPSLSSQRNSDAGMGGLQDGAFEGDALARDDITAITRDLDHYYGLGTLAVSLLFLH